MRWMSHGASVAFPENEGCFGFGRSRERRQQHVRGSGQPVCQPEGGGRGGGGVLGWVMGDAGLTPICPLPPHSPTSSHPNMPCLLFPICSEGSFGVWIPKRPGSLCRPGPGFGFLGSGHWPRCAPPMDGQSKTSWLWATPGVSDLVPDLSAVPVFPRTSHFLRLFIYAVHLYQEK